MSDITVISNNFPLVLLLSFLFFLSESERPHCNISKPPADDLDTASISYTSLRFPSPEASTPESLGAVGGAEVVEHQSPSEYVLE